MAKTYFQVVLDDKSAIWLNLHQLLKDIYLGVGFFPVF